MVNGGFDIGLVCIWIDEYVDWIIDDVYVEEDDY